MEANWERDVLDYHKKLIALRHAHPALRTGVYEVLHAEGTLYIFARILGAEKLIVAVNIGTAPANAHIQPNCLQSQPSQILFGSGEVSWASEGESPQMTLKVPPRSGCILG
jgi:glycosidase